MPAIIFILSILAGLLFTSFMADTQLEKNAKFEAANCPEMLQADSQYCKPIE